MNTKSGGANVVQIALIFVCFAASLTLIIVLIAVSTRSVEGYGGAVSTRSVEGYGGAVSIQKSELFSNELLGVVAQSGMTLHVPTVRQAAINPNVTRIIANKINVADMVVEPKHIEKANKYHDTFNKHKDERHGILRKLYDELGKPKTVDNWVRSCELAGINVRKKTITFSLDRESYDKTVAMGFKTVLISNDKYEEAGGSVEFGDDNFSATMFYKNAFIYDLLSIVPENNYVLFQDSDLIWFRDPTEYLENNPEDLQIMYDGENPLFKELYANTGFIFLRNNQITRSVMETALGNTAYILSVRGHQKIFNRILAHYAYHNVLSLKVLPELTFVNGHLLSNTTGKLSDKLKSNWKSEAYVMHYSWTGNINDKFKKLNNLGLNYIKDKQ